MEFEESEFVSILLVGNPYKEKTMRTLKPATSHAATYADLPTDRGPFGWVKLVVWALTATTAERRHAARL